MEKPQLDRSLSLFSLIMMGMGMMIGAGVFVASGISISKGGSGAVIIAFSINGLIALFTAMSYAELSSAIPRAGGPYNWASFGLGKFTGFLTGWMEWLAAIVAGSLYAITFALYTVKFSNEAFSLGLTPEIYSFTVKTVAFLIALVFIYINYRGASETGAAAVIMAAGQMITLGVICIAALITVIREPNRVNNFQNFLPAGWDKILVAMGLTYVAFEGFEVICQAGDEAIDPEKNIPKALFYSLLAVVTVYILLSLAMTIGVEGGNPMAFFSQGNDPSVRFSDSVMNLIPYGGLIVTIAVIFSATSALNSTIYSATRISFALGRDQYLPPVFASIVEKTRIPGFALLITSIILLLIALTMPIEHVAAAASILFIFVFMIGNIAVIKIRKDFSDKLKYGYIMPFFPYLTLIAIGFQFIMIFKLFEESSWTGPIVFSWLSLGAIVFLLYSKSRANPDTLQEKLLEVKHLGYSTNFKVLVPIANPHNIPALLTHAIKIAEKQDGEIILFNYIHVPDQSPMEVGRNYLKSSRKTIVLAENFANNRVPVSSIIKYGRHFYKSVMNTIRDYEVDLLIMGWRGTSHSYFSLGSKLNPILENVNCDSMVIKMKEFKEEEKVEDKQISNILIPSGGGSQVQTKLAIRLASLLMTKEGEIKLFTLKSQDQKNLQQQITQFTEFAETNNIPLVTEIVPLADISKTISDEYNNNDYDLLILGASRGSLLNKTAFGVIPENVAKNTQKPVMMVKSPHGVKSFVNRWLGK
ncbi:MAG: amino acid permease [Deltaproteobacteria bacterium]|jgi:APA family basic amino acid/polyamine antiporter|nr:amino acid permease [Deltaproteobacteria bacterium]